MGSASSAHKKQVFDGCQMCKIGAKIQWQCLDCNLFLCDRCKYSDHDKFGAHHNIRSENKSSSTIQQAQSPIGCQMCNKGARIQWKCEDCKLSICDHCQYSDHQKFGAHHNIINIKGDKAPAEESKDGNHDNKPTELGKNRGSEKRSTKIGIKYENKNLNIKFKVVNQYTVETMSIHLIAVSPDRTLWVGDNMSGKILHMKLSSDSVTVLSSFNFKPFSLAISPTGSTFIVAGRSILQIIDEKTGQLIDTKYTVHPWLLTCIHVTWERNIILGGTKVGDQGCVVMIDQKGKELVRYENNKGNPILTYPQCIATTRNGNIFIADGRPENRIGRVVRIKPRDRVILFYNGHSDINSNDKPFHPVSILVTTSDNVLILNLNADYLHILKNEGDFISYFNLTDIGVIRPFSLALSPSGNIYTGGVRVEPKPPYYKATIYELEFSGI